MYVLAPRAVASMGVAAVACGYALLRGGAPERAAAAAVGGAWLLSPAVQLHPLGRVQWGVLGLDAASAAVLLAVALRSDRWWPLFAAALNLLILVEHLTYIAAPRGLARAYFAGEEIWGYALLMVLAAGAALEGPGRRLRPARSRGSGPAPRPPGTASP